MSRIHSPKSNTAWTSWVEHTPDELLVSLVARLGSLNAIRDPRDLMEAVAGRRTAMISLDLPTNLEAIAERLPNSATFATPAQILESATLFPYFRPFARPELWDEIVRSAAASAASGIKLRLGLTCHGFGASMGFRFCHACVMERWKRYGSIAWTRACNLPEVGVCPIHRVRLVEGMKQSAMSFRQRIPMPDLRLAVDASAHRNTGVLARFAELSRELLTCGRGPVDVGSRVRVLREALRDRGFIRGKDQVRWTDLSLYLLDRHNHYEGFTSERHLLTQRNGALAWLPSVLSTRKASHPVVNLLLIDALFDGLEAFFARVDACGGSLEGYGRALTSGKTRAFDDQEHLHRRDSTRRFWLDLHESNPTLSTTNLRPRMKAEYAWLHRNDRDWMRAHSRGISAAMRAQPSPRVDWARRDIDYTGKLVTKGDALLRNRSGRPFTMTRLLKMVGPETTLRKHLHKLPKLSEAVLTLLAHSRQEYMLRSGGHVPRR